MIIALSTFSCRKKFEVHGDVNTTKVKIQHEGEVLIENYSDSAAIILNENLVTVYILPGDLNYNLPDYSMY